MMWWDYGTPGPWYAMILGPLMMIALVVLTAVAVAWVLRASGLGWQAGSQQRTALDILKERFARGEINREEYEERKQLLSHS